MKTKYQIGEFVRFKLKNNEKSEQRLKIERLHFQLDLRLEENNKQWIIYQKQLQRASQKKKQRFREIAITLQKYNKKKESFLKLIDHYKNQTKELNIKINQKEQQINLAINSAEEELSKEKQRFQTQSQSILLTIQNLSKDRATKRQIFCKKQQCLKNHKIKNQIYLNKIKEIDNLKIIHSQKTNQKQKIMKQVQYLVESVKQSELEAKRKEYQQISKRQFNINQIIQKIRQKILDNNIQEAWEIIQSNKATYNNKIPDEAQVKQIDEYGRIQIIQNSIKTVNNIVKQQMIDLQQKFKIKILLFDESIKQQFQKIKQQSIALNAKSQMIRITLKRGQQEQKRLLDQESQLNDKLTRMKKQIERIITQE